MFSIFYIDALLLVEKLVEVSLLAGLNCVFYVGNTCLVYLKRWYC